MEVMNKAVQRVTVPGVLRVPLSSVCLDSTAMTQEKDLARSSRRGTQHVHAPRHVGQSAYLQYTPAIEKANRSS